MVLGELDESGSIQADFDLGLCFDFDCEVAFVVDIVAGVGLGFDDDGGEGEAAEVGLVVGVVASAAFSR